MWNSLYNEEVMNRWEADFYNKDNSSNRSNDVSCGVECRSDEWWKEHNFAKDEKGTWVHTLDDDWYRHNGFTKDPCDEWVKTWAYNAYQRNLPNMMRYLKKHGTLDTYMDDYDHAKWAEKYEKGLVS